MAVRNRRKCSTCPVAKPTAPPQPEQQPMYSLSTTEGLKLWKHVLFGTTTCISMIEGYAKHGLPGDPLEGVRHLRDHLNAIITFLETRPNVTDAAE